MVSSVLALVWRKVLGMLYSNLLQVSICSKLLTHDTSHYITGACGLVGYSSVGVYKSIRNIKLTKRDNPANLVRQLGEVEYAQANEADKLHIVRLWCQIQMRVRLT